MGVSRARKLKMKCKKNNVLSSLVNDENPRQHEEVYSQLNIFFLPYLGWWTGDMFFVNNLWCFNYFITIYTKFSIELSRAKRNYGLLHVLLQVNNFQKSLLLTLLSNSLTDFSTQLSNVQIF